MSFTVGSPQESGLGNILKGLGEGVGEGVNLGLQSTLSSFQAKKKNLEKNLGQLRPTFDFHKKLSRLQDLPEDDLTNIYNSAKKYIEQGIDADEAVQQSINEYRSSLQGDKEGGDLEKIGASAFSPKDLLGILGRTPEIFNALKERETPEGPSRIQSLLSAPLKGGLRGAEINPLQQFTSAISPKLRDRILSQILPTQDQPLERILETGGELAPLLGVAGGGAPLIAAEAALGGGGKELARQLGGGEVAQEVGTLAGISLPSIGKWAASKLFNNLSRKFPIKKPAKTAQIEFKGGKGPSSDIPSSFTGPHSAQEAEKIYEDVFQNSIKNLNDRGITLEAINSGEPAAVRALQEEVNKSADLFKKSQKLNIQELNKKMAETEKRLAKSPLEKYYEVKPEPNRRPETIAARELKNRELQQFINEKAKEAQDLQVKILGQDSALKNQALDKAGRARIESLRKLNSLNHTRAIDAMRNARFEMKYGRPPATMEQIGKQIEETFSKLREGIEKPDVKKVEDFRKGFERDKHLIDLARDLAKKGELPGEVFDEYIKIHKKYVEAYGKLIDELKDFISQSTDPAKIERAKDLLKIVQNNQKLGKAKIKIQEDKRKAMRLLDKPSGSFMKNSLRNMRPDVEAFQKDFIKWNKLASEAEKKTEQVAKKVIGQAPKEEKAFKRETQAPKEPPKVQKEHAKGEFGEAKKAAEEVAANPQGEKAKTAAERSGMSKEEYKEYINKIREKTEKLGNQWKEGNSSPSDEKGILNDFVKWYKKLPPKQRVIGTGVLLGGLQGTFEEVFGWKPQTRWFTTGGHIFLPGGWRAAAGSATISNIVAEGIRQAFDHEASKKLQSLRKNPKEYNDYMRKLKSKHGNARANRIRKQALDSS